MAPSRSESPRKLTAVAAYLILLCSSPILVAFAIVGKIWIGFGTWICLGLVALVVRTRWDLRRHFWFWIIVACAGLLQIPIVLWIPWNDRTLTWITFLPVGALDYVLVHGCIRLAERALRKDTGTTASGNGQA